MFWPFSNQKSKKISHSPINGDLTIGKTYGFKTLFANGIPQSGGEFVRMWGKVFTFLPANHPTIHNVLVLGVGGGTVIQLISNKFPNALITGVDIDPIVIHVATDYFDLQKIPHLKLRRADAITYIKRNFQKKYDLIVVDLYIREKNPIEIKTPSFHSCLTRLLNDDGIVLFNCDYNKNSPKLYDDFVSYCQSSYRHVQEVYKFPLNRILLLQFPS